VDIRLIINQYYILIVPYIFIGMILSLHIYLGILMIIYLVLKYLKLMEENRFGIKKYYNDYYYLHNCIIVYKPYKNIYIIRYIKGYLFGIKIFKTYGKE